MKRIEELTPVFCDTIPEQKESGILYISEQYKVCIHLCACGCGEQAVLPFNKGDKSWLLKNTNGKISIMPSIGNFSWEKPNYHAHYYITDNRIVWC